MDMEQIEIAMDGEEDLFFADLKDRISLLIMEDDDYEELPSDSYQAFSYARTQPIYAPPLFMYDYEAPYTREPAKGTGVFIPTSSIQPRKKNRSTRSKQAGRARKKGGPDPPSTTPVVDRFNNSHAQATCMNNNTNLAKKHRQQLSAKKKGMVMC